jgi:hypothetical protein
VKSDSAIRYSLSIYMSLTFFSTLLDENNKFPNNRNKILELALMAESSDDLIQKLKSTDCIVEQDGETPSGYKTLYILLASRDLRNQNRSKMAETNDAIKVLFNLVALFKLH